jgi:hypothetical protein
MKITFSDALASLCPTSNWIARGDEYANIEWLDEVNQKPTEMAIQAEVVRLQANYDSKEYQRKRALAYPSIPDQLDLIYHQGLDAWKSAIQAVKEEFPK